MEKFYKKNNAEKLPRELFAHPGAEYRGAPFWAWNGVLNREELLWQIEVMKKMGMGGFHMHVRTGLDTPYLGEEYFGHIKACIDKAEDEKMLAWLYDEDRWPSGSAGGSVTKEHPEYAAKGLLLTVHPYEESAGEGSSDSVPGRGRGGVRQENGRLLAVYDVSLSRDGTLVSYSRIGKEEQAAGKKWYAYLEQAGPDPWFNDGAYVDTLQQEAVADFIKKTHTAYQKAVGEKFGGVVPAVFTDEPQFNAKSTLDFPEEEKDVFLPWTVDFEKRYREKYHCDILETLPELLWELPQGKVSLARYRYHDFVAERFAENYCGSIGAWCRENGIRFTGHVMGEGSLREQTMALGECMRCYKFFDIPGIDILCDHREYTAAKQVQSAAHQQGAEAVLSELYGVTGWDYDFRGYKMQGDWQAALGVTVRVPHLFWMSMKGEAKRDFPPCIGYQSPWYEKFSLLEDYFARLNTALTRGKPKVRIAVIHPIESYWLHWGPEAQTGAVREQLEQSFQKLTEYLLFSLLDFDFISEHEFPALCRKASAPLTVGCMQYDAVVVCGCETLRSTTLERLEDFAGDGGDLIFVGDCPEYIDVKKSDKARPLYEKSRKMSLSATEVRKVLGKYAFAEISGEDGRAEDSLLLQVREDGEGCWLFLAGGRKPEGEDVDEGRLLRFALKGCLEVECYDAMSGEIFSVETHMEGGRTCWERRWYLHDSLLLYVKPAAEGGTPAGIEKERVLQVEDKVRTALPEGNVKAESMQGRLCLNPVNIKLTEPNMCLLDMAEFAVDDRAWQPAEEILRIDNLAREMCGLPLRRREVVQPYLLEGETAKHKIRLRFTVESRVALERVRLGLEEPKDAGIFWNGEEIPSVSEGYYVDKGIETVILPGVKKGENLLEVTVPLGKRTNLEAMYLLGEFGVQIRGTRKVLTKLPEKIGFGDITSQGLPFYTGNLDYSFEIEVTSTGEAAITVPAYRGALIQVFLDEKPAGHIIFSPYELKLQGLSRGMHRITLRLYGTRQNGFGQLHHTSGVWFYQGPNSWRSSGRLWRYEYQLKETGILTGPVLTGGRYR